MTTAEMISPQRNRRVRGIAHERLLELQRPWLVEERLSNKHRFQFYDNVDEKRYR